MPRRSTCIGRGLDTINPLDAGPLGTALAQMTGPAAAQLRWEVRSRRLSLLMALVTLIREAKLTNAEEVGDSRSRPHFAVQMIKSLIATLATRPVTCCFPGSPDRI